MKKGLWKKVLAAVVALALVVTALVVPKNDAKAEDTKVIYLNAGGSGLWDQAGAWFSAHAWNSSTQSASDLKMTLNDQGYYEVEIPSDYNMIIFCRMDNTATSFDWGKVWNQTADLTIPSTNNMYTITGWGNTDGSWSTYTPPTEEVTYYITGIAETLSGAENWDPANEDYVMTKTANGYEFTKTLAAGEYSFKVTDGTWDNTWPAQNYTFRVSEECSVTINMALNKAITVTGDNVKPVYYVIGLANNWTFSNPDYKMTEDNGVHTWTTTLTVGTHQYKVTDNTSSWSEGHAWPQGDNASVTIVSERPVTFTFDPSTGTTTVTGLGMTEPSYSIEGLANEAIGLSNSNGVWSQEIIGLQPGEYSFTIKDDAGQTCGTHSFSVYVACDVTVNYTASTGAIAVTGDGLEEVVYSVSGTVNNNTPAEMTESNGEYTYTIPSLAVGEYTFKVSDNYDNSWPAENYAFTVYSACDVTIKFDPTTGAITVTGTNNGLENAYSVSGHDGNNSSTMVESDGVYTYTATLGTGDYTVKVTDKTGANWSSEAFTVYTAGEVTITFDPSTTQVTVTGNALIDPGKPGTVSPVIEGNTVTFYYTSNTATSVTLAGNIGSTDWSKTYEMVKDGNVFSYTMTLEPGTYEYKYIVNGSDWQVDPLNPNQSNGNSVLTIVNPDALIKESPVIEGNKVTFYYESATASKVTLAGSMAGDGWATKYDMVKDGNVF